MNFTDAAHQQGTGADGSTYIDSITLRRASQIGPPLPTDRVGDPLVGFRNSEADKIAFHGIQRAHRRDLPLEECHGLKDADGVLIEDANHDRALQAAYRLFRLGCEAPDRLKSNQHTLHETPRRIRDSTAGVQNGLRLRPHQLGAIGDLDVMLGRGSAALLRDDTGLGKTLTTIGLICHLLEQRDRLHGPVLIIAERSTLETVWIPEILRSVDHVRLRYYRDDMQVYSESMRQIHLTQDLFTYEIVCTTYDTIRTEWQRHNTHVTKVMRGEVPHRPLLYMFIMEWSLLVVDEVHRLGKIGSNLSRAIYEMQAENRLGLTATLYRNRNEDISCAMFRFMHMFPFANVRFFQAYFSNASSVLDKDRLEMRRAEVLSLMLDAVSINRTGAEEYDGQLISGPPRAREYDPHVVPMTFRQTMAQILIRRQIVGSRARDGLSLPRYTGPEESNQRASRLMLRAHIVLICDSLVSDEELLRGITTAELRLVIDELSSLAMSYIQSPPDHYVDPDMQERDNQFLHRMKQIHAMAVAELTEVEVDSFVHLLERLPEVPIVEQPWTTSPRMLQAVDIVLGHLDNYDGKVIVFSSSIAATQLMRNTLRGQGIDVEHYDGTVDQTVRLDIVRRFQVRRAQDMEPGESAIDVLIIGIKAGAESLTLDEASCVIFLNRNWTPANEKQAIGRADRLNCRHAQVRVHRFHSTNSIDDRYVRITTKKIKNASVAKSRSQRRKEHIRAELMQWTYDEYAAHMQTPQDSEQLSVNEEDHDEDEADVQMENNDDDDDVEDQRDDEDSDDTDQSNAEPDFDALDMHGQSSADESDSETVSEIESEDEDPNTGLDNGISGTHANDSGHDAV